MRKKLLLLFALLPAFSQGHTTAGDNLFNVTQIHTISINFPQPNYWALLVSNKAYDDANDSSTYIPSQVVIDGNTLDSVGVQFKGNSSYYNYPGNKKPFTLSFDEYRNSQLYDSLTAINLNNCYQDPSFMREKMFLDFLNSKGLYAPRSNYVKVYINGSYWGFYQIGERVNKTFCKDRFGNKGGNLFKGDKGTTACANLKYHSSLSSYYGCYTLKTNTGANDWSDLVNLTRQVNLTTDAAFKDSVDAYLDAASFLGAWAACNVFVDFDAYAFRFVHNYYIYHNTATGKFEWITWDVNTAFGMDVPGTVTSITGKSILYIEPDPADRPLAKRMLANTAYKDRYLAFICDFMNTFQPSILNPRIDSLYSLIKADVYADPLKMYSNSDFDSNINSDITVSSVTYPGLKPFIQARSTSIRNELNSLGITCAMPSAISEVTTGNDVLQVIPNPSSRRFTVSYTLQSNTDVSLRIADMLGRTVKAFDGWQQAGVYQKVMDIDLPSGIYTVSLKAGDRVAIRQLAINR